MGRVRPRPRKTVCPPFPFARPALRLSLPIPQLCHPERGRIVRSRTTMRSRGTCCSPDDARITSTVPHSVCLCQFLNSVIPSEAGSFAGERPCAVEGPAVRRMMHALQVPSRTPFVSANSSTLSSRAKRDRSLANDHAQSRDLLFAGDQHRAEEEFCERLSSRGENAWAAGLALLFPLWENLVKGSKSSNSL